MKKKQSTQKHIIENFENRVMVSYLLNEISDKSLSNILRKIILGNEVNDILSVIHTERPELAKYKTNEDYIKAIQL